jgi:hypothetical protein
MVIANRCGDQAMQLIEWDPWAVTINYLSSEAATLEFRVLTDASYAATLASWVSCMRAAGYAFRTPDEAFTAARPANGWTLPIGSATIEQARTDFACQERAALRETRKRLAVLASKAWVDEHPEVLSDAEVAKHALLAKCATLVPG